MTSRDPFTYLEKETLHDISFSMGHAWAGLTAETRSFIMNELGGSRALAEVAMLWAESFDAEFIVKLRADPDTDTYLEDVGNFFTVKWEELIAHHVTKRLTQTGAAQ